MSLFCVGYVGGVCLLLEKGWASPSLDGDCGTGEVCWSPGLGLWVGVACVACKARRRTFGLGWTSCLPGRIGMDLLPSRKDWDGPLAFQEGLGWTSCLPGRIGMDLLPSRNIHDR